MRRLRKTIFWLAGLLIVALGVGLVVLRSDWFLGKVRERIISELEHATGGRAEIGSLEIQWTGIQAKAGGIVLHGLEPSGAPPLLRIESLAAGLSVTSWSKRTVDLRSLVIRRPEVHLTINKDGTTNIPGPQQKNPSATVWSEDLLRLKIGRLELTDGTFELNDRKLPLEILAEKFNAALNYESVGPLYRGNLKAQSLRIAGTGFGPLNPAVDAAFTLKDQQIQFSRLKLDTKTSHLELTGALTRLNQPRGDFELKGVVGVPDLPPSSVIAGAAMLDGKLQVDFATPANFRLNGSVVASGLSYRDSRIRLDGVGVQAAMDLTQDHVVLTGVNANALGAQFQGSGSFEQWRKWRVDGHIANANARRLLTLMKAREMPWDGNLSGELHLSGIVANGSAQNTRVEAHVGIVPAASGPPLTGHADILYDQDAGTIHLDEAFAATASTRVEASGTLGSQLTVRAQSTNLNDLLPIFDLLGEKAPESLPVELNGGAIRVEGALLGELTDPKFKGHVQATRFRVEGHSIEKVEADLDISRSLVKLSGFSVETKVGNATGTGQAVLDAWKVHEGAISAQVQLQGVRVDALAKEFGQTLSVEGVLDGSLRVAGTANHPVVDASLRSEKMAAYGEHFTAVRVTGKLTDRRIELASLNADAAGAHVTASGWLDHPAGDYRNGTFHANGSTDSVVLDAIQRWRENNLDLSGKLQAKVTVDGRIVNGNPELTALNGDGAIRSITFEKRRAGDLTFSAKSNNGTLSATAALDLHGEKVEGTGQFQLNGDYPLSATIRFPRLSAATLHDLRPTLGGWDQLPFDGFVSGNAVFAGSLSKPESIKGELTLDTVQISAKAAQKLRLGIQAQDVTLKNSKPVKIVVTKDLARISDAQFTAQNTSIEVSGQVGLQPKADSSLVLRGNVNLAILQLVNPDLLAKGDATVDATVRGSISEPRIRGRLELKKASLYLADLPNGVDNANGIVVFDNGRATIQSLVAETGGGQLKFSGFLEYGGTALVYRLQAQAETVRVRYPEDVSITFNSQLSLSGTSENSLLAGTVTVNKISFQPRTDLGQLLASTAKPVPTVSRPNEYLRGMQFDIRIESGADMQVNTSLSSNVQADVDLRLRGSPIRPALLGSVSVDSGDIQVFGNRYTINRGEIRFFNPVKIEPVFDMDLETKARAVIVNISFSGTISKLNVTYRSDPPLQTREIIALLAVGRDPNSVSATGSDTVSAQSSFLQAGNSLLGQAVSAQLSNRLQRFFGVSRVKIDPQLTGVEAIPQARLTLEQQVSRDITVTYITNLNRTQEQIVRLEWDLSRNWSMIALRDSNGVFGIDFQFRKRFK
ncbi:MAG: translocation/assembly module TamB domain-containing protein [Bryobacteraceae bacterium]